MTGLQRRRSGTASTLLQVLQSMEVPLIINKGVKLLEMQARFNNERLVQGIRAAAANELALDAIEEGEE